MSFVHPAAWWWAGLAILIALLYLGNVASRRYEVADYWLWQRALARRPVWHRIRFWLSLAAQVAILLLLVAALAEPYWTSAAARRRTLALVLDASASMAATDVDPSRFAAAQAEARRIFRELQRGERAAIVSAADAVRIECRLTDDPRALLAAIDHVQPALGGGQIVAALRLAERMLAAQPNPSIALLTDACFPQAESVARGEPLAPADPAMQAGARAQAAPPERGVPIYLTRLGAGGHNRGISRLAVRPDPHDPSRQWMLVEAVNSSDAPTTAVARYTGAGAAGGVARIELTPGSVGRAVEPCLVKQDGVLTVQLEQNDDLAADDQAAISVTARHRPLVYLVTDPQTPRAEQAALHDALTNMPDVDVQQIDQLPSSLPEYAIIVFDRRLPERLPACPLLAITPRTDSDLWSVSGALRDGESAVKSVRRDSPLLEGVRLEDAVIERAVKLDFKQPADSLAASMSGDGLYSRIDRPVGPALVLHADLRREHSDLTLRRDFPRLVENAVRWLSGMTDAPIQANRGGRPATDADRSGPSIVNLLDRDESMIRAGLNVPSRELPSPDSTAELPLWVLLTSAACVLLLGDWCLFHRRLLV